MKTLFLIVLLFGFLAGNAQQDLQNDRQTKDGLAEQLNTGNDPGYPINFDPYRYEDRRPDNDNLPVNFDLNRYTIKDPDNGGLPVQFDLNRYRNRKTDNIGAPVHIDLNRYTIKKPD